MKYISLGMDVERALSFYLAMEEYIARHIDEPECLFLWQIEPSVIIGRNQVVENEVNIDYCREHDINIYRRKSGGGCVYADTDNLMISYIGEGDSVGFIYHKFIQMIMLVLRKMGIEATSTRHNDILIGDKKVCGTAFYKLPGRGIAHSTMLYDTNMEHMLHAITPSAEKLEKNGVQSVRQRITLLKDHTSLTLEEVKALIRETLCEDELVLTPAQIDDIEKIYDGNRKQTYLSL